MKKFMVSVLALAMAMTAFGCKPSTLAPTGVNSGDIVQGTYNTPGSNKTTIRIASMAAGLGSQWLINASEQFAKENAETSFADGKKGVYLELTQVTRGITTYFTGIATSGQNIVFTESGYALSSLIDGDKFYPVTDIVRDTTRVGGTIEDKMYDNFKEVFKKGDDYYALPHAEFYGGLSYNHDVFEEHSALLADASCASDLKIEYMGKYNNYTPVYFASSTGIGQSGYVLSAGPDGEKGTTDDGLPCSVEEFMIVCDYFRSQIGIPPLMLTGAYKNMVNYFINGMWAALAGQEQMQNYYSLNGEIEVVTGFSNENLIEGIDYVKKPITQKVTITPANAYLGNDMAAKYYAIAMAEMFYQEGLLMQIDEGNMPSTTHTDAQKFLIYSSSELARTSGGNTTQTAMLMDGTYWINESYNASNFSNYDMYSNGAERPDIRYMALPTSVTTAEREVAGYVHKPSAIMDINFGACVVNANIAGNTEVENAVKAFLKFFYSEEQLKNYTRSSRQFIALSYDFTDDELKELDPFYQSLWKLRDNKNGSNIVYASPRAGSNASTMATYRKAIPSTFIALQSTNLKPTKPGVGTNSPYGVFENSGNLLNGEGLYTYGSQFVFDNLKLTPDKWIGIYAEQQ